jgi:hypothetical protein
MKLRFWMVLLLALVFATGFTLGVIAGGTVEGKVGIDSDGGDGSGRPGSRSDDGGSSRHLGPYLASIEEFEEALALDAQQQDRMQALVDETTAEVARRERDIAEFLLSRRSGVEEILTLEQKDSFQKLIDEKWKVWRQERVRESVEWFERRDVDPDTLERVRQILTTHEDEKGAWFRGLRLSGEWPSREEMEIRMQEWSDRRHELLSSVVGEKLASELRDRGRRHKDRRPDAHRGKGC